MANFMDLPLKVRVKIYTMSGLVRLCPIDIIHEDKATPTKTPNSNPVTSSSPRVPNYIPLPYPYPPETFRSTYRRNDRGFNMENADSRLLCTPLPTQLFYVSKAFYSDTVELFYGRNKFVVRGHAGSDLTNLLSLGPKALAAMTSLLVRLNTWPCPNGHEVLDLAKTRCLKCRNEVCGDPPCTSYSLKLRTTGNRLKQWEKVCKHMAAAISPVQLRLTFICDVEDLAAGERVVASLANLPRLKACTIRLGRPHNQELSSLAAKTSLRMTGGFIPEQWFPFESLPKEIRLRVLHFTHIGSSGTYYHKYEHIAVENGKLATGTKLCCSACTETYRDCCCTAIHSSHSESCKCRRLPTSLFSVSRQMRYETLEVLLTQNCLEFSGSLQSSLRFLRGVPVMFRQMIRRVSFRFTSEQIFGWFNHKIGYDWKDLVTYVRNLKLDNLCIAIDLSDCGIEFYRLTYDDNHRLIYKVYLDVTQTLGMALAGRGLCDLHFHLGGFRDLRPWLEQQVMGEAYDSTASNKYRRASFNYAQRSAMSNPATYQPPFASFTNTFIRRHGYPYQFYLPTATWVPTKATFPSLVHAIPPWHEPRRLLSASPDSDAGF